MSALQQAKALHKLKKVYRRGLLKKHVQQSRLGTVAAAQDHYIIKIHLTTDKTGKKKIEFTPNLLINVPATNIAGPQHRDFMIKERLIGLLMQRNLSKEKIRSGIPCNKIFNIS